MKRWLIHTMIHFAVKFGVPFALNYIPFLSPRVKAIIAEFVQKLADNVEDKQDLLDEVKGKIAEEYKK